MVEIESGLCNLQMTDNESICFTTSKSSIPRERRELVRPLARKDIFYSGSVVNLPEFKSQKSLASYRQSVISLPKYAQERGDVVDFEKGSKLQKTRGIRSQSYNIPVHRQLAFSLACENSGGVIMQAGGRSEFARNSVISPFKNDCILTVVLRGTKGPVYKA